MMDRLNTKDIMLRKSWVIEGGPACVLCDLQMLETRDHLFFECPYAQECWHKTQIQWNMSVLIQERILMAKNNFTGPCFMETFACVAWNIWNERNGWIFRLQQPLMARWSVKFSIDTESKTA
jgi:hypothetical protein